MAEPERRRIGLGKVSRKALEMASHPSQGVDALARTLTDALPPDEGDARELEIEKIRPDPQNGRDLQITFEILTNPEPHPDQAMRDEVEAIRELAASIKQDGMFNPIVVYEDGIVYRIVTGERRYWANRLLNKVLVKTKVLANKPIWLRRIQYSENANRRNLDLAHQLKVKQQVADEAKANGHPLAAAEDYVEFLNISQPMAYRWKAVLEGPPDVREAIQAGKLTSIVAAAAAAAERDQEKRQAIIEGSAEPAAPAAALVAPVPPGRAMPRAKQGRGRPVTAVKVGSVKTPGFARWIAQRLDKSNEFKEVDWSDKAQASKALKDLLKRLEKKFEEGGLK